MRIKSQSNSSLILYTFISLLLLFAATVDIDGMAEAAMASHEKASEQFITAAFQ